MTSDGRYRVGEVAHCLRSVDDGAETTSVSIGNLLGGTGSDDDPLGLRRDGWDVLEFPPFGPIEVVDGACANQAIHAFDAVPAVGYGRTRNGDRVEIDVRIVDVGSAERGTLLADDVMAFGRCQAEADGVESSARSLPASRASWVRIGRDIGFATVVGDSGALVVIAISADGFGDDVVNDLIQRSQSYLRVDPSPG